MDVYVETPSSEESDVEVTDALEEVVIGPEELELDDVDEVDEANEDVVAAFNDDVLLLDEDPEEPPAISELPLTSPNPVKTVYALAPPHMTEP